MKTVSECHYSELDIEGGEEKKKRDNALNERERKQ